MNAPVVPSTIDNHEQRIRQLESVVEMLAENLLRKDYAKDMRHVEAMEHAACGDLYKAHEGLEAERED